MAIGEAPEEYIVELGDTLIDICDQLIDEPGYWPKLWSMNPYIKNPHFIFPGMKLRFYSGDNESPPFLQVVSEDDVLPIDKADIKDEEVLNTKIDKLFSKVKGDYKIPVVGASDVKSFPEIDEAFVREGEYSKSSQKKGDYSSLLFQR